MFSRDGNLEAIRLIIVSARDIELDESPLDLKAEIAAVTAGVVAGSPPEAVKNAVRDMLRTKAFKPTGRNKPASEYLAQAASEERFPSINNAVDVNNLLSLETGFPISLLDSRAVGDSAHVRLGREGESYVFNQSGHEIELEGLAVICNSEDLALGNAIKDSMAGKIKTDTKDVCGFVWVPRALVDSGMVDEGVLARRFCDLLERYCGATQTSAAFL